MKRIALAAGAFLLVGACSREETPERPPEMPRPPVTHVPREAVAATAELLAPSRFPASHFAIGPHALLRDSAAWTRFWSGTSNPAVPMVDFSKANVLAMRVFDATSPAAAAPRVSARGGMTFLVLTEGAGPPRPAGADSVALYLIPTGGGPIRYVAYEPRHHRQ
jgi:hypothetical protein